MLTVSGNVNDCMYIGHVDNHFSKPSNSNGNTKP